MCARIVDSLFYWVREMHVDGFRFDLASIFTRNEDGAINTDDPPVVAAVSGACDFARIPFKQTKIANSRATTDPSVAARSALHLASTGARPFALQNLQPYLRGLDSLHK